MKTRMHPIHGNVMTALQMTNFLLLPPANEVCEGNVFPGVCLSTGGGGVSQHALGRGVYHSMHWAGCCVSQHALGRRGVCLGVWQTPPGPEAETPTPSRYYEIQSTSGQYTFHWKLFLFSWSCCFFFESIKNIKWHPCAILIWERGCQPIVTSIKIIKGRH